MNGQNIRIRLKAFDHRILDASTREIVNTAKKQKTRIIAITDSKLSPIAAASDVAFEIKDAEVRQFRSLTASLCLAQTLVISYAFGMDGKQRGR